MDKHEFMVLYFSFTRVRSVLYSFRFLSYVKYCFYPRIEDVLITK